MNSKPRTLINICVQHLCTDHLTIMDVQRYILRPLLLTLLLSLPTRSLSVSDSDSESRLSSDDDLGWSSDGGFEPIFETVHQYILTNKEDVLRNIYDILDECRLTKDEHLMQLIKPTILFLENIEKADQCQTCLVGALFCYPFGCNF